MKALGGLVAEVSVFFAIASLATLLVLYTVDCYSHYKRNNACLEYGEALDKDSLYKRSIGCIIYDNGTWYIAKNIREGDFRG